MKARIRPLGYITLDLEKLLEELVDTHDLQTGEILALVHMWIQIHRPSANEEYLDGSNPQFKYGPQNK